MQSGAGEARRSLAGLGEMRWGEARRSGSRYGGTSRGEALQARRSRALLHGSAALTEGITLSLCNHTFPSPCTQSEVNATDAEHRSWLTRSGSTEEQSPPSCWVVFITQERQQDPALWLCSSTLTPLGSN